MDLADQLEWRIECGAETRLDIISLSFILQLRLKKFFIFCIDLHLYKAKSDILLKCVSWSFPTGSQDLLLCLIVFKILDAGHYKKRFKDYLLCQHVTRTETAPGSFLLLVLKKSMVQDAKTSRRIEKSLDAIFKDTIVHAGRVDQIGTLLPKYPMIISLFGFLYIEI